MLQEFIDNPSDPRWRGSDRVALKETVKASSDLPLLLKVQGAAKGAHPLIDVAAQRRINELSQTECPECGARVDMAGGVIKAHIPPGGDYARGACPGSGRQALAAPADPSAVPAPQPVDNDCDDAPVQVEASDDFDDDGEDFAIEKPPAGWSLEDLSEEERLHALRSMDIALICDGMSDHLRAGWALPEAQVVPVMHAITRGGADVGRALHHVGQVSAPYNVHSVPLYDEPTGETVLYQAAAYLAHLEKGEAAPILDLLRRIETDSGKGVDVPGIRRLIHRAREMDAGYLEGPLEALTERSMGQRALAASMVSEAPDDGTINEAWVDRVSAMLTKPAIAREIRHAKKELTPRQLELLPRIRDVQIIWRQARRELWAPGVDGAPMDDDTILLCIALAEEATRDTLEEEPPRGSILHEYGRSLKEWRESGRRTTRKSPWAPVAGTGACTVCDEHAPRLHRLYDGMIVMAPHGEGQTCPGSYLPLDVPEVEAAEDLRPTCPDCGARVSVTLQPDPLGLVVEPHSRPGGRPCGFVALYSKGGDSASAAKPAEEQEPQAEEAPKREAPQRIQEAAWMWSKSHHFTEGAHPYAPGEVMTFLEAWKAGVSEALLLEPAEMGGRVREAGASPEPAYNFPMDGTEPHAGTWVLEMVPPTGAPHATRHRTERTAGQMIECPPAVVTLGQARAWRERLTDEEAQRLLQHAVDRSPGLRYLDLFEDPLKDGLEDFGIETDKPSWVRALEEIKTLRAECQRLKDVVVAPSAPGWSIMGVVTSVGGDPATVTVAAEVTQEQARECARALYSRVRIEMGGGDD